MNQILAAVDIGTNTILLTIARRLSDNRELSVISDEHSIARLGQGVDSYRRIHEDAILRAESIVLKYKEMCDTAKVDYIRAVGTSCLRDAANRDEVCRRLSLILGTPIDVISGDEEARLCFLGSIEDDLPTTIVDIGGGSTELISGKNGDIAYRTSIDIGAVRLTERYFKELPPSKENIVLARQEIQRVLSCVPPGALYDIRAVAGTPTTLTAMILKLTEYNPELIHNYKLMYHDVEFMSSMLTQLPLEKILLLPGVHPKRADILPAGVVILQTILEYASAAHCTVSTKGLRYGVLLDMILT